MHLHKGREIDLLLQLPWYPTRTTYSAQTHPAPGKHVVGVEFTKAPIGQYNESHGPIELYVDDKVVAEGEIRTMTGHFSLCSELWSDRQQRSSQQRVWLGFSFQRGRRSTKSCSTWRTMRMWMSSGTCRQRLHGLVEDLLTPDETWRSLSPSHGIATFPCSGGQANGAVPRSIDALKPPTTVVIRRFHQLLENGSPEK